MTRKTLRACLEAGEFIAAPGVFDLLSAKIAGLTAAKALYMTGYGTVASYLGYPDAGLATYTDMVDRAAAIARAVDAPLISNQLHGGRTPILPQAELKKMGFSGAIYPTAGLFAAAQVLASVYDDHANDRAVRSPLYAFDDFAQMIGFQKVWDFEEQYADLLAAETGES